MPNYINAKYKNFFGKKIFFEEGLGQEGLR